MTDWCTEVSAVYEVDHPNGRSTVDTRKNLLWVLERLSEHERRRARVFVGRNSDHGDYVYDLLKDQCGEGQS
jgi:hypothetical protein